MLYNLTIQSFHFFGGLGIGGGLGLNKSLLLNMFLSHIETCHYKFVLLYKNISVHKKMHKVNKAITIITTAQLPHKTVRTN